MSDLLPLVEEFCADFEALDRRYPTPLSPSRRQRFGKHLAAWRARVEALDFDGLVDATLLRRRIERDLSDLRHEEARDGELESLLPFAGIVTRLEEARRDFDPIEPEVAAQSIQNLVRTVDECRSDVETGHLAAPPHLAHRASTLAVKLRDALMDWFTHGEGYDPLFSWWLAKPVADAREALTRYAATLREKLVGVPADDDQAIVGLPIGRTALEEALALEMIPYTPEELIAIGDREYAWCEAEMTLAAKELGFEVWMDAVEHVKGLHEPPGGQPGVVRELAIEAVRFLKERDLLTIPPLAEETWRMEMMSAEAQKVSPFFLGGETIIVSFPTDTMTHDQKRMSMRGNNTHFSRATVQHELIPGHHMQFFMLRRHRPYRRAFGTPFWIEGWALYWEMLLWDLDFARGPEDRIGMLFWRMHRCARIVFSLRFHLGEMSPAECIDFLVQRVGHERANAEGEVRRSFSGDYPPLYQLAYMIGGLQLRALAREADAAGITRREFHDRILRENQMPLAVLREVVLNRSLTRDFRGDWRFDG